MNVENNHTADTEREQTKNGTETITIQTTLGDEGQSSETTPIEPSVCSVQAWLTSPVVKRC